MDPEELKAFRQELRRRKIAEREALPAAERAAATARIGSLLGELLEELSPAILAFTWPLGGEVDLRPAATAFLAARQGRRLVLPVVVAPRQPLVFREWTPGCAMEEQRFGVMVPASGELLRPDLILLPPVAFDEAFYRLGYGAGFYDRTLAALAPRPLAVGVAFELSRCSTIHPQDWDQPLDFLITEAGRFDKAGGFEAVFKAR